MRKVLALTVLFYILQNSIDKALSISPLVRKSRVKRETGGPLFPSWLEETVQKSGKRSREEILVFMQNLGIKFERVSSAKNVSTENPAERSRNEQNAKTAELTDSVTSVTGNKTEITSEEPNPTMKQATMISVNEIETNVDVGRKIFTTEFDNVLKSESKMDMNATKMTGSSKTADTGNRVKNMTVGIVDTPRDEVSTNKDGDSSFNQSGNASGSVLQNEVHTNSMPSNSINTVNDKMEPTSTTRNENKSGAVKNTERDKDSEIKIADESTPKDIGRKIKNIFSI